MTPRVEQLPLTVWTTVSLGLSWSRNAWSVGGGRHDARLSLSQFLPRARPVNMNIRAARWAVVLLALVAVVSAEDYEYDEAPAPAKPLRPSPLLRQARGPVIGRPAPKAAVTAKTTTTTEAAPPPEYADEEFDEDVGAEEDAPTTTTEAPKKAGLKTGVVRPFRSNADLIETLKRRRQQQGSGGHSTTTSTTTQQPTSEKGFKNGRRASSSNKISAVDQTGSTSERKSTVNGRRFNGGGRSAKVTTSAEPPAEEVEEQPARPRMFGRGRRF